MQIGLNLRDLRGILADDARRDNFRHCRARRQPASVGERFAPACVAVVSFDFDQQGVHVVLGCAAGVGHGAVQHQRGADQDGFDAGDFHDGLSLFKYLILFTI